jgi:hypothetical protein
MVVDVITFLALVVLYVVYDRHAMRSARAPGRRPTRRAKIVRLRIEDARRRHRAAGSARRWDSHRR